MGPKDNVSMVILEKDKAKVVAVNGGQDTMERKQSIPGHGVGVAVEVLPVEEKLVSVSSLRIYMQTFLFA